MPFIFSRRYIQSCLTALRSVLTEGQYENLVRRLNTRNSQRLSAMWEAVVLSHLSSQPGFRHEVGLPGGRKPDFQFLLPKSRYRKLLFWEREIVVVGDITGVSDSGARKANPVEYFLEEFRRCAEKYQFDMSQFEINIGDTVIGAANKRKVPLLLPRGDDRKKFFDEDLRPYLKDRSSARDYGHRNVFAKGEYHIEVVFKEKTRFARHSHAVVTSAKRTDHNPIWERLKDKADQLRKAPKDAVKVVILCDCGCDLMRRSRFDQSINHGEVIVEFLRRESGVDIVFALTEVTKRKVLEQPWREHEGRLFASEKWLNAKSSNHATMTTLEKILHELIEHLPASVSNVESAALNSPKFDYWSHGSGGLQMGVDKISFSARTLHNLLASKISLEEFDADYGGHLKQRFAHELAKGSTIADISVVSCGYDADDDRIEVTFQPDPAFLPFK